MKVSKEAILGIIFIICLIIACLYMRSKKCDKTETIITGDKFVKEMEDSLRKDNHKKDSVIKLQDSLLKLSESRENKIQYIYVEKSRIIDRATLRGKDSILRANLGI